MRQTLTTRTIGRSMVGTSSVRVRPPPAITACLQATARMLQQLVEEQPAGFDTWFDRTLVCSRPRVTRPDRQVADGETRPPRPVPGSAGDDAPPDAQAATVARLRPGPAHPSGVQGRPPDRGGLALPRAPAAAPRRSGEGGMGPVSHQPSGPALPPHLGRLAS